MHISGTERSYIETGNLKWEASFSITEYLGVRLMDVRFEEGYGLYCAEPLENGDWLFRLFDAAYMPAIDDELIMKRMDSPLKE